MTNVTTDGALKIANGLLQKVVVKDIGLISGWMVGELYLKVKEIHGDNVLVEVGVKDTETKRLLVKQVEVWLPLGSSTEFTNYTDQAFYVAQHVTIS
jgi:hypothetical protein